MRPGDTSPTFASTKPPMPTLSLIHSAVRYDGHRPGTLETWAPIGSMDVTGNWEDNAVAKCNVPVMLYPHKYDLDKNPMILSMEKWLTVVASSRQEDKPQFTLRGQLGPNELRVFPDASKLYIMATRETIQDWVSQVQFAINDYESDYSNVKFMGLGVYDVTGPVPKLKEAPPIEYKFGEYRMRFQLDSFPMSMGESKSYVKYIVLLASAIKKVMKTFDKVAADTNSDWKAASSIDMGPGGNSDEFYLAMAYFMLLSYDRGARTPPKDLWVSGSDVFDNLLDYLGLPWSESYPFLQPVVNPDVLYEVVASEDDLKRCADMVKSVLCLNCALAFAVKRIGTFVLPAMYKRQKGSNFQIRAELEDRLPAAYNAGGSYPFWLAVANNRPVRNAIYFPTAVDINNCGTLYQNTVMSENFDVAVIERAEEKFTGEFPNDVHRMLQISRDARMQWEKQNEFATEYLIGKIPLTHHGNREPGLGVILSYLSDGTTKPGGLLPINGRIFLDKKWDLVTDRFGYVYKEQKEGSGLYDQVKITGRTDTDHGGKEVKANAMSVPGLTSPGKPKNGTVITAEVEPCVPASGPDGENLVRTPHVHENTREHVDSVE